MPGLATKATDGIRTLDLVVNNAGMSAYSASKHAGMGITEALAMELGKRRSA